jgi:hypothetical protein
MNIAIIVIILQLHKSVDGSIAQAFHSNIRIRYTE